MRATAQIRADGSLMVAPDVLKEAGLRPGDSVEMGHTPERVVIALERTLTPFGLQAGMQRNRPPMSLDEIVAEQREMRGHDNLELDGDDDLA